MESTLQSYVALVRRSFPDETRGLDDVGVVCYAVTEEDNIKVLHELLKAFELEFTELLLNAKQKYCKIWHRIFGARNRRIKLKAQEVFYERAIKEVRERISKIECG